jgi:hypothetical protein
VYGQGVYDAYQTGPDSCMKGENYVDFYSENPEKVGLLKIMKWGKYYGRALLWNLDDGRKLLDRIYPSDGGHHVSYAIEVAKACGWDHLPRQTYGETPASGKDAYVSGMKNTGHWPYMDTLRFTNEESYEDPININSYSGDYELSSTEGNHPNEDEEDSHDDETWSNYQDTYIPDDDANIVHGGDWVDGYTLRHDFTYVERQGEYYENHLVVECDYTEDAYLIEDTVETYEGLRCVDSLVTYIDLGSHAGEYAYDEDPRLAFTRVTEQSYIKGYYEDEEKETSEDVEEIQAEKES